MLKLVLLLDSKDARLIATFLASARVAIVCAATDKQQLKYAFPGQLADFRLICIQPPNVDPDESPSKSAWAVTYQGLHAGLALLRTPDTLVLTQVENISHLLFGLSRLRIFPPELLLRNASSGLKTVLPDLGPYRKKNDAVHEGSNAGDYGYTQLVRSDFEVR